MPPPLSTTLPLRVRYVECDPMGYAHHSCYAVWFEMARTQLLADRGIRYRDLEEKNVFIVVARINISYHKPARYDDQLQLTATLRTSGGAKIEHDYSLHRDSELLATGQTTLACIDPTGKPMRIPDFLTL